MALERDTEVLMPVEGVYLSGVSDTWGAARSEGRSHEGTDIFAPEGTPVYAATSGYVQRIGSNPVGGNIVSVIGGGGVRYYYAHLSGFAEDLQEGQYVTPDTLLGYVGNTGNAALTPPHLHLGVYAGESYLTCDWDAENPYSLLVDSFEVWWLTLIYLLAMTALGLHLRHGTWSAAQTLGLTNNHRARRNANVLGYLIAVVVAGGFSLVPLGVLVGAID